MSERHLVLVGMMGAGKTSVGRRCAARLERAFVDTDDLVESTTGHARSREIFETQGEPAFRDLERVAVADACASPEPLVIACGGGAVLDADNRRALRDAGVVVWLRAAPEVLSGRVGAGAGAVRPLLAGAGAAGRGHARAARGAAGRHLRSRRRTRWSTPTAGRVDEVAAAVVAAFDATESRVSDGPGRGRRRPTTSLVAPGALARRRRGAARASGGSRS